MVMRGGAGGGGSHLAAAGRKGRGRNGSSAAGASVEQQVGRGHWYGYMDMGMCVAGTPKMLPLLTLLSLHNGWG